MSAISLSWVSKLTVGNQTAKQLLQFLASHSFHKPGFFFSISTLCAQLETSESSLHRALKLLLDKSLLLKEERFCEETGRRLTNCYYLNIPDSFVDNYFKNERVPSQISENPPVTLTPSPCHTDTLPPVTLTPLNNNNINNKDNKRERASQRATPSLSSFVPSEDHVELANDLKLKIDIVVEAKKCMDYYKGVGKPIKDWGAVFNNWLRREASHKKNNVIPLASPKSEPKQTAQFYEPDRTTQRAAPPKAFQELMQNIRRKSMVEVMNDPRRTT